MIFKNEHNQQTKVMSQYETVPKDYSGYITAAYKGSYNWER